MIDRLYFCFVEFFAFVIFVLLLGCPYKRAKCGLCGRNKLFYLVEGEMRDGHACPY